MKIYRDITKCAQLKLFQKEDESCLLSWVLNWILPVLTLFYFGNYNICVYPHFSNSM